MNNNNKIKWKSNINIKDGFDVVIGNPPYFNVQILGAKSPMVNILKEFYKEIWMDKSDILFYFIGKAIELSKKEVIFIISNAFLFSDKAKKLRNFILENAPIRKIVNFEKIMVFENALITSAIISLDKSKNNTVAEALVFNENNLTINELNTMISTSSEFFKVELKKNNVFALINNNTQLLNNKIDSKGKYLSDLVLIGKGMETASDQIFLFKEKPIQFPEKFIKKRATGLNIDKYFVNNDTDYVLYFEDIDKFKNLPESIQEHLLKNENILKNRADKKRRTTSKWWNYTFAMHKEYYDLPKIFCSRRALRNTFAYSEKFDFLTFSNMTVIFQTNEEINIKFILALLNSKTLNFRYKSIGKQTGGGLFEFFPNGVGKLPIPEISLEKQQSFIKIVDQIMEKKKLGLETKELEDQIDQMVYLLYNLTQEEIDIVEKI